MHLHHIMSQPINNKIGTNRTVLQKTLYRKQIDWPRDEVKLPQLQIICMFLTAFQIHINLPFTSHIVLIQQINHHAFILFHNATLVLIDLQHSTILSTHTFSPHFYTAQIWGDSLFLLHFQHMHLCSISSKETLHQIRTGFLSPQQFQRQLISWKSVGPESFVMLVMKDDQPFLILFGIAGQLDAMVVPRYSQYFMESRQRDLVWLCSAIKASDPHCIYQYSCKSDVLHLRRKLEYRLEGADYTILAYKESCLFYNQFTEDQSYLRAEGPLKIPFKAKGSVVEILAICGGVVIVLNYSSSRHISFQVDLIRMEDGQVLNSYPIQNKYEPSQVVYGNGDCVFVTETRTKQMSVGMKGSVPRTYKMGGFKIIGEKLAYSYLLSKQLGITSISQIL